ncbi:MAG: tRNA (adenosine(37)-N6)-threonylcarbamoyltransferase complex dimerization subunit type 1 TsaB [Synergistaceae bacterium]|jgi:tRNA threonylcarbamoyladenosine biosynthesis protein TsaB|nr:tRNA (adenosine(37)-N6)-threonylcarbamoyltransferase complex dimerization subunit type 1 TsaB [Synergistaceae bacterium]
MLLALDCALRRTSAALALEDGEIISAALPGSQGRLAENLPEAIELVLSSRKMAGRRVDADGLLPYVTMIAVTNGPGYFMGVRSGVAFAAALAYGLGVGVVPVSTLHMLALPFLSRGHVLAVAYSGRGRVYAESYGANNANNKLPPNEYEASEAAAWSNKNKAAVTVVSDDPAKVRDNGLNIPDILLSTPDAASVAKIADPRSAVNPMALRAVYLKAPQTGTITRNKECR